MNNTPTQASVPVKQPQVKPKENSVGSSEADKLINIMLNQGVELFVDQFGQPFIIQPDFPLVAQKIKSKSTLQMLSRLFWMTNTKAVSQNTLTTVVTTLQGIALHRGIRREVYNRVAQIENTIYYDLGDNKHVAEINPEGWSIKTSAPIVFRRFSHQRPQVMPIKGGDLKNITRFFNISDGMQEILLVTSLPVCLIANIARPLILLHGPQGSGKSMALELIRQLIDPSMTPLLTPSNRPEEIAQQADHNYCYFLDNLSEISDPLSDTLCKLVTGGAFAKRELYSDEDDILFRFKRVTGFNGVAQFADKPDLLDRSLILQLERINDKNRQREESLRAAFEKELPSLLGGLFDSVSIAMRTAPNLKLNPPRMADYYFYAAAVSQHLGYGIKQFEEAYSMNIDRQNQHAIESSPVAQTIIQFMTNLKEWAGNSSELFSILHNIALTLQIERGFPKSAIWLWRKIQEAQYTLASSGIIANRSRDVQGRKITLVNQNIPANDGNAGNPFSEPTGNEASNGRQDSNVSNPPKVDPYTDLHKKVQAILNGEKP